MIPLADLAAYEANARTHPEDQIAALVAIIANSGFTNPLLIEDDGTIIAGHGRLEAATRLGMVEVPCVRVSGLSPAQIKALRISDNAVGLRSAWDQDLLTLEVAELAEIADFDLGTLGLGGDELEALLNPPSKSEADPDEVPEPPAIPVTRPGDVWMMDKHRIICGDSTDAETWAALAIPPGSMAFTSPPYGVGDTARIRDRYVAGADTRKSLYATHEDAPDKWPDLMRGWTDLALTHCDAVICNVQMLANNKRPLIEWMAQYAPHLVDVVVWDKEGGAPQMQAQVLTNAFEWVFILSAKSGAARTIPMAKFHGTQSNIVRINPRGSNPFSSVHGAVMPVKLAAWALDLMPKAKAVVDPFGGVGTTAIAAETAGRVSRLIELDPAYVDVAVRRWEDFAGRVATLEATGQSFREVADERRALAA